MSYLIFPQDLTTTAESQLGGKAVNLVRLAQLGARVPRWFAISTEAYQVALVDSSMVDQGE
ncbi:MAG: hypothetical protein HY692_04080, partial [Cyanobacteria bacterium NC_groundwater_1444_Ag_S-0.65um_54_12]|nr:hypothetical protein [Cyanobacteria bacterium NC_groundwater_1444_Ag_S-0.65um_54_12]